MTTDEHIKNKNEEKLIPGISNVDGVEGLCPYDENVFDLMPKYGSSASINRNDLHELEVRVQDLWHGLKTKEDLLHLLNVALAGLYGEQSRELTMSQLNKYAYTTIESKRYTTFKIPKKKKGEFRTIDAPVPELKYIQRALNFVLQCVYIPNEAAMGFVRRRSVVDNAKMHTGQRMVYNIDLKDFFPSITSGRVYRRLMAKPFCLTEEVASIITDLCCYINAEGRHVLPQGAPTSPTLTNIICEQMDRKLTRLAKAYGLKYSRYADDISFSGMTNVFYENSRFCLSLRHIVEEEEHFTINANKTRLCHQGMRQEVTGLTVNRQENVSRKYIKQLRTLIHNWEMDGYEKAQDVFAKHYAETNTRHLQGKGTHHIENIIAGKLMYLKMVKGETDTTYRSLYARFNTLMTNQKEREIKERETLQLQQTFIEAISKTENNIVNREPDEIVAAFAELEELLINNME